MDLSNFKKNIFIKDSGAKIIEVEEVFNNGEMDLFMKDIGKIMLPVDMED